MKAETKKQEPGTIRRRSSYNRSLRKDNRQLFSMCVPGIILLALFAVLFLGFLDAPLGWLYTAAGRLLDFATGYVELALRALLH